MSTVHLTDFTCQANRTCEETEMWTTMLLPLHNSQHAYCLYKNKRNTALSMTLWNSLSDTFKTWYVCFILQKKPRWKPQVASKKKDMSLRKHLSVLMAVALKGNMFVSHILHCLGAPSSIRSFPSFRILLLVHSLTLSLSSTHVNKSPVRKIDFR